MTGGSFTFAERNIYGVTAGVCDPAHRPSRAPWVFRQLVPDGPPIPISILTDPSQGYVPLSIGDWMWEHNTRGLTVDRDGKLILATPDELIRIDPSSGSRELLYGSMATGGGIAGFTIETEPAGTLLYVRRWWTSDRPSGLYRVSPIPPAPFSVSPPPQLVAARPYNLSNAPDLALDAHGRPLLLVQPVELASEYGLYRVNPVDGSVAVVLRFPTLRGGDFNRIAIVPPRPFDDCNPTSLSVQLCNTNLIASAQPTGTAVVDFSLDGWFSIAKGAYGLNLLEEAVTVRIDDVSMTLPEGSLKKNQNGEYVFDGKVGYVTRGADVDTIPLRLRVTQIGGLQFTFAISGTAKLGTQAGETTVNLIVGNDRGSAKTIAQIFKK